MGSAASGASKKGAVPEKGGDKGAAGPLQLMQLADQSWEKHKNPGNPSGAKGAVKLKDKNERTPLAMAVRKKRTDMVRLLLEHKADVEAIDKSGNSILIDAVATCMKT